MSVMTVSRETGSGGHYIAEKVAQILGFHVADKNVIGRVYSKYCLNEFGTDSGYIPDCWTYFDSPADERREFMVSTLNQVVQALAHQDNMVIIGRSGFAILAEFVEVLHVRIQAPIQVRIKRLMERRNITGSDQAEALVREGDRVRAAFIERFYGRRWDCSKSFDMVLDMGKISDEIAIDCLVMAIKGQQIQPHLSMRSLASIHVDPILTAVVAEELSLKPARRK